MAPFLNAFNEKIEVRYSQDTFTDKWTWGLSKGSSGSLNIEEAKLVALGYVIAVRLMDDDESDVTTEAQVDKFIKAYWAKRKRDENKLRNAR